MLHACRRTVYAQDVRTVYVSMMFLSILAIGYYYMYRLGLFAIERATYKLVYNCLRRTLCGCGQGHAVDA